MLKRVLVLLLSLAALVVPVGQLALVAAHAEGLNPNCSLILPANPLTATGLATPYRLTATDPANGPCAETNLDQSAFVEAAVLDPATGQIALYHPLVVTDGTSPPAPPVVPVLPASAVVAIWFGSNGETLKLVGSGAKNAVNGLGTDLFGQFSYINAPSFFRAANQAIQAGQLVVPPLGVGNDQQPCPTTRDFAVVDQDQSDNVATPYWVTTDGQMSQVPLDGATKMVNGSDEGLLSKFIDPALGCAPWKLPSLDGLGDLPSLAANELSAAAHQGTPVALTPLSDPMTLRANGGLSVLKTNLYRAGVDQPFINPAVQTPAAYCASIQKIAPARRALDSAQFSSNPGPGGSVLATFLADRYTASLVALGCTSPARFPTGPLHPVR